MAEHPERQLIPRFFANKLEPAEWDGLVAHLRQCKECGAAYDEARKAAEGAADDEMTQREVELASAMALKRLAAAAATGEKGGAAASAAPVAALRPARGPGMAAAWGGVVVAAAAATLLWWMSRPASTPELRVAEKGGGGFSADLFCLEEGRAVRPLIGDEACPAPSRIMVRATSTTPSLVHLTVISCQGDFDCRLESTATLADEPATADGPRLAEEQRLRIFVLWSPRALAASELQQSAQAARQQRLKLFDTLALPSLPFSQIAYTVHAQK